MAKWVILLRVNMKPESVPGRPRHSVKLIAAGLTSLALVALVGCSSNNSSSDASPSVMASSDPSSTPSSTVTPAPVIDSIDGVKVTEKEGAAPTIEAPIPFSVSELKTRVISEGTGPVIAEGATVELNYLGMNARTGEIFDSSYARSSSATFSLNQVITGFAKGLAGQKIGSKVLLVIPSSEGYPQGQPSAGIDASDTLIFFCEIINGLTKIDLSAMNPNPAGFPSVSGDDGLKVSTAGVAVPATTTAVDLVTGTGAAVADDSTITLKYAVYNLADGSSLYSSMNETPGSVEYAKLVTALKTGLKGHKAGSRVMVVAPAAEAYPNGNTAMKIEKGTNLVFIVDLLMVTKTATQS